MSVYIDVAHPSAGGGKKCDNCMNIFKMKGLQQIAQFVMHLDADGSLSSLMADSLSPILVKLTRHESNPDIVLLALRAMTYLCDINPQSSSFLVRHDVVPALCQRLMAIEYLDVAKQVYDVLLSCSEITLLGVIRLDLSGNSNVTTVIDMKLEKHKNLREEFGFCWREICDGTLQFDGRECEVAVLKLLDSQLQKSKFYVRLQLQLLFYY
ncbi:E3 ubiquitin-protein ligase [Forsythia ovata]|uniref:HECT-type E3 ubiquitin transferase n=1 Tax=Forsythia ovata TaxID=205694 RepID=A0ABD1WJ13_9LAMI